MSLWSIYQSGCDPICMIEVEKNQKDNQKTTMGEKRSGEEDTTDKRTLVLGITTVDNYQGRKIIKKRKESTGEARGNNKSETESMIKAQSTVQTDQSVEINGSEECEDCEDHEDDEDEMSWPELFANQLMKMNEHQFPKKEEDAPMIPNPFFKDLLFDFDSNIRSCNNCRW